MMGTVLSGAETSSGEERPQPIGPARTFLCKIPVQGTVAGLMDALLDGAGPDPLHRPLPGGTGSIYDG
jgi:hypothetical protein